MQKILFSALIVFVAELSGCADSHALLARDGKEIPQDAALTDAGLSDPQTTDARTTGGGYGYVDFLRDEQTVYCAKAIECDGWQRRAYRTEAFCMTASLNVDEVLVDLAAGRLQFEQSFAEQCLAEFREARCETSPEWTTELSWPSGGATVREPEVCSRVLIGILSIGDRCPTGAGCRAGSFCEEQDERCAGRCAPLVATAIGEPCSNRSTCAAGSICKKDRVAGQSICVAQEIRTVGEGGYCGIMRVDGEHDVAFLCQTDLYCDFDPKTRVSECRRPHEIGESCKDAFFGCSLDSFCNSNDVCECSPEVCVRGRGAPCDSDWMCDPWGDLYCEPATRTCVATSTHPREGERCLLALEGHCEAGFICTPGVHRVGYCARIREIGESCEYDSSVCTPGRCVDGQCVAQCGD